MAIRYDSVLAYLCLYLPVCHLVRMRAEADDVEVCVDIYFAGHISWQ